MNERKTDLSIKDMIRLYVALILLYGCVVFTAHLIAPEIETFWKMMCGTAAILTVAIGRGIHLKLGSRNTNGP